MNIHLFYCCYSPLNICTTWSNSLQIFNFLGSVVLPKVHTKWQTKEDSVFILYRKSIVIFCKFSIDHQKYFYLEYTFSAISDHVLAHSTSNFTLSSDFYHMSACLLLRTSKTAQIAILYNLLFYPVNLAIVLLFV